MDLNDKPAMKDVSGNKLNHSITDTTKQSHDSTDIVVIVIPVALVIVTVVVIVVLCLRRKAADTNIHGQDINLIRSES